MIHTHLALLASILISTPALAHVEPGIWAGMTADGKPCSLTAEPTYYENSVRHPLHERVPVTIDGERFLGAHPPVVDAATSTAYFNHDVFHAVLPTPTGARALVIEMSHDEDSEGPTAFHVIDHQWRTDTRAHLTCHGLKHQP